MSSKTAKADTVGLVQPRRKQRSVKSLGRVEVPTVSVKLEGLTASQVGELTHRVEALQGVGVVFTKTHLQVICRDPNTFVRIFRAVEDIIEDVT